jgi:hypothetical protein
VEKDMGMIVRAAIQNTPGKTILAVESMLSWTDQLKLWCKTNGVSFGGFNELSVEKFEMILPIPGLGRELGEMMAFMDESGYTGGDPNVTLPQDVSYCLLL